jgi:glycosyltransferase involved in cell wall biosynthesis
MKAAALLQPPAVSVVMPAYNRKALLAPFHQLLLALRHLPAP